MIMFFCATILSNRAKKKKWFFNKNSNVQASGQEKIEKSILTPFGHLGKNHPVAEIKIQLQVPLTSRI